MRHLPLFLLFVATYVHAAPRLEATTTIGDAGYTVHVTSRAPTTVRVSADPAAKPDAMRVVGTTKGSGEVTMPFASEARQYFLVSAGKTSLRTATRQIPLEGASNFRDLGGYAGKDGKHVVWGHLFRSNALAELTPRDYQTVDGLGVRVVCDLRTDEERTKQPTKWEGPAPTFVTSPKASTDPLLKALLAGTPTADSVRAGFIEFYRKMPEIYAPEMRAMFERLVSGETPFIVHCTAGKDRSGLASALILSVLGVPRATIEDDYAMSASLRAAGAAKHGISAGLKANMKPYSKLPPEVMAVIEASDPAYLRATFEAIDEHYGSVDAYLEKALGVGPKERAKMQALYLE